MFDIWWAEFICLMILDHAKLGCALTFMKDLSSIVTLSFLWKTLIWAGNKSAKEHYLQKYYIHVFYTIL